MTVPYLEIDALRREYGAVVAIDSVALDIKRGEFMTFLGPSGSGKSTTLYILAGLDQPTSGDIRLEGASLLSTPPQQRNIGMVFQRYTLFPHLSVAENVGFPLKVRRRPRGEIESRVKAVLRLVRLENFEDRRPAQMSGGQQQRVALARALIYDPPVLLMDEPLSALDKKLREEIQFEIRRIHRETGVTILYVTHDQEEALRLSDRIAVFSKGVIDQVGTGAQLYADPATAFVAGFIGDSDFLPCQVLERSGDRAKVQVADAVIASTPVHGDVRPGPARLMLRPERISLHAGERPSPHALAAEVRDVTFLGASVHVAAQIAGGALVSARIPYGHPSTSEAAPGRAVWLDFSPLAAHCFKAAAP